VLYDYIAHPRIIKQPIEQAVTHPDGAVPTDVAAVK